MIRINKVWDKKFQHTRALHYLENKTPLKVCMSSVNNFTVFFIVKANHL